MDTAKKDHLSTYGYDKETTPFLDTFDSESTKFTNAVSQAPWTLPSHGSMFTGKYPSEHGAIQANPYLEKQDTLASILSENGYETGMFSANAWISPHTGLAHGFDEKNNFIGNLPGPLEKLTSKSWKAANENKYLSKLAQSVARTISWFHNNIGGDKYESYTPQIRAETERFINDNLDQNKFVCLNLLDPHLPYKPPIEYVQKFSDLNDLPDVTQDPQRYNSGAVDIDSEEWEKIKLLYDAEIRYLDNQIKQFIQFLKEVGEYEDSLIIICSDHGELHGSHDIYGHQFGLYEDLLDVPMLIKHPGVEKDQKDGLVELMDIFHTVIDFTDVDNSVFNGERSIFNDQYREGKRLEYPNHSFAEYSKPLVTLGELEKIADRNNIEIPQDTKYRSEMSMVRDSDGKYIYRSQTADEFYSFDADNREENVNSLRTGSSPKSASEYRSILQNYNRVGVVDVEHVGSDAIDDRIEDRLSDLGYLEK